MASSGPILVVGNDGQLGTALRALLASAERAFEAPSRDRLDLTRLEAVAPAIEGAVPSAVINAAAFTDVNAAELPGRREEVDLLNRDAPREIAVACRRLGIPLIHVSTDYVFDGTLRRPYREDDPPSPLQVYGLSKLEGERAVLDAMPDAAVLRTSTVFGASDSGRSNYVKAVMRQAREKGAFDVVRLPVSSPTYAVDLAAAILELVDARATGVIHCVNSGSCSRLELAREIAEIARPGGGEAVGERPEPEGGLARPPYSVLDTSRLEEWIGRPMRNWREAVRAYVEAEGL
jgi:dTDP-4-dehydrorhamnose reductase